MAAGCTGLGLSYNNYDNWNTNTNCSPHLSIVFSDAGPASWQKKTHLKRTLVPQNLGRRSFKSKGYYEACKQFISSNMQYRKSAGS